MKAFGLLPALTAMGLFKEGAAKLPGKKSKGFYRESMNQRQKRKRWRQSPNLRPK